MRRAITIRVVQKKDVEVIDKRGNNTWAKRGSKRRYDERFTWVYVCACVYEYANRNSNCDLLNSGSKSHFLCKIN